jgi:hypothetical protein
MTLAARAPMSAMTQTHRGRVAEIRLGPRRGIWHPGLPAVVDFERSRPSRGFPDSSRTIPNHPGESRPASTNMVDADRARAYGSARNVKRPRDRATARGHDTERVELSMRSARYRAVGAVGHDLAHVGGRWLGRRRGLGPVGATTRKGATHGHHRHGDRAHGSSR